MATNIGNQEGRTKRLDLPLLYPGQAHKEAMHNEALARLDALIGMSVEDTARNPDNLVPENGQCWLISLDATGLWDEKPGYIAVFIEGDWLYLKPYEGQMVYIRASAARRVYRHGFWREIHLFASPLGGDVVDNEARAAILSLRDLLWEFGFLVPQ